MIPGAATLHWGGDLCKGEVLLAKNEGATWETEGGKCMLLTPQVHDPEWE